MTGIAFALSVEPTGLAKIRLSGWEIVTSVGVGEDEGGLVDEDLKEEGPASVVGTSAGTA